MTPDLSVRELCEWAGGEVERLRGRLSEQAGGHPAFVLAQAAKLAEEVGELQAEVLGLTGYQRRAKGGFTADGVANELADVLICAAVLAVSHGVDLGRALAEKIERVEARHRDEA